MISLSVACLAILRVNKISTFRELNYKALIYVIKAHVASLRHSKAKVFTVNENASRSFPRACRAVGTLIVPEWPSTFFLTVTVEASPFQTCFICCRRRTLAQKIWLDYPWPWPKVFFIAASPRFSLSRNLCLKSAIVPIIKGNETFRE